MVANSIYDIVSTLESSWPLFIGDLPSTKEECICILEYDGYSSTEYFKQYGSILNPLIKIVIRTDSYEAGKSYSNRVKEILHRYHGDSILSILIVGAPMYLGRSETKLHEFQVTFQVQVKE